MRIKALLLGLAVFGTALVGTAWAGDDQKKNDVVLLDRAYKGDPPQYVEVFKKEGTSGKNYLYTKTNVFDPVSGQYCTIFTFASETAGFGSCQTREQVEHPELFTALDPVKYPDRKPT